jgi:Mlc titration factor MtfA (ptsG expression regulator)
MNPLVYLVLFGFSAFLVWRVSQKRKSSWKTPSNSFPSQWRLLITKEVAFYNSLNDEEKTRFEFKVQEFLLNCRITGIKTEIDVTDKLLVASSAIIPIFAFPDWKYINIHEVLIYPDSFNDSFEFEGDDRSILGMVGTGYMEGKMILSKSALKHGFENESDKMNTAIHEFVHLIDKADGVVDGVPAVLLEKQYSIPWIDLINKKIEEIYKEQSDINPYGGTNKAEFFSVTSEYFFERPKLLKRNHPELYALLEQIFKQDMSARNLNTPKDRIGRNSRCPCASGKKFKHCCGRSHYS